MWWAVLFISACIRSICSLFHGWLLHSFVHSKPPGRKMVSKRTYPFYFSFMYNSGYNGYQCVCTFFRGYCCDFKLCCSCFEGFNGTSSISCSFYIQPDLQDFHLSHVWCVECFSIPPICYHH